MTAAGGELGPDHADFERRLVPNSVMLFRYSALTSTATASTTTTAMPQRLSSIPT